MEIFSKRMILKEITRSDLEQIHDLQSKPEIDEFNTLGIPQSIEITKERLRQLIDAQKELPRKSYNWKIIEKETDEFIGQCGFNLSLNRFKLGEIYYNLLPEYWGKGYATEVARLLVETGFKHFHLHKVEAGVATENIRSIKVLEKAGMTREGLRRKILPIRGEWKDNYHYAIVEDDERNW